MNKVNSLKVNDGLLVGQYTKDKKYTLHVVNVLNETSFSIKAPGTLITNRMTPMCYLLDASNSFICKGFGGNNTYESFNNYVHYFDSTLHTVQNLPSDNSTISYTDAKGFSFNTTGYSYTREGTHHIYKTLGCCELISGYFSPKQGNNYRKAGYFRIVTGRNDLIVKSVVITSADYGNYWDTNTYQSHSMPAYIITYCEDSGSVHNIHWHKSDSPESNSNVGDSEKVYFMAYLSARS